jgi:Cu2+-exporting ATPase
LLIRWGLDLPMSVGAIAMSMSTIIVAANAQLLRRLNLRRENAKATLITSTAVIPA